MSFIFGTSADFDNALRITLRTLRKADDSFLTSTEINGIIDFLREQGLEDEARGWLANNRARLDDGSVYTLFSGNDADVLELR